MLAISRRCVESQILIGVGGESLVPPLPDAFLRVPLRHAAALDGNLSPRAVGLDNWTGVHRLVQNALQPGHGLDGAVVEEQLSVVLWIDIGAHDSRLLVRACWVVLDQRVPASYAGACVQ